MQPVIAVRGLTKRFGSELALSDVDLTVPPGVVFALLGENGAGKTTLIRTLMGFEKPDVGTARVLGLDAVRDALAIRRRTGYVADSPALYDWMRVGRIGWFASAFYAEGYLQRYERLVAQFEVPRERKIKHLSKGMRAKVALALALAHNPELLVLDEPTSGLDPLVRRQFLESMVDRAAGGETVLLSSHQIAEVERVADWVAILHHGRVRVVQPLAELKASVREVVISMSDPASELPPIPGEVLYQAARGKQRRLLVRGCDPDGLSALERAAGVLGVQQRTPTLEEIFIACTHDAPPDAPGSEPAEPDAPEPDEVDRIRRWSVSGKARAS